MLIEIRLLKLSWKELLGRKRAEIVLMCENSLSVRRNPIMRNTIFKISVSRNFHTDYKYFIMNSLNKTFKPLDSKNGLLLSWNNSFKRNLCRLKCVCGTYNSASCTKNTISAHTASEFSDNCTMKELKVVKMPWKRHL